MGVGVAAKKRKTTSFPTPTPTTPHTCTVVVAADRGSKRTRRRVRPSMPAAARPAATASGGRSANVCWGQSERTRL